MINRSLICITTCNRLAEVKKYIWDYIIFCNRNSKYHFLLALDGCSDEYLRFCEDFSIPLLYSDQREGVGQSKNRVLKSFPSFDYYFFIEDDVELVDERIFDLHINTFLTTNIHHLCVADLRNINGHNSSLKFNDLSFAQYGGATFNFFTRKGLELVGGWHTTFIKYRRYGHTEHTYRFFHKKLSPAPFCMIKRAESMLIIHDPPHVSSIKGKLSENQLVLEEEEMIRGRTDFFPITTISEFRFNKKEFDKNQCVQSLLQNNKRKYPLTKGKKRRKALAEHYFLRIRTTKNIAKKALFFVKSIVYNPLNTPFKHFVKVKIFGFGK